MLFEPMKWSAAIDKIESLWRVGQGSSPCPPDLVATALTQRAKEEDHRRQPSSAKRSSGHQNLLREPSMPPFRGMSRFEQQMLWQHDPKTNGTIEPIAFFHWSGALRKTMPTLTIRRSRSVKFPPPPPPTVLRQWEEPGIRGLANEESKTFASQIASLIT